MGCCSSVSSPTLDGDRKGAELSGTYILKINDKCPHIRLDHNEVPRVLRIEGESLRYNLKYCYVSQRGYYPNGTTSPICVLASYYNRALIFIIQHFQRPTKTAT